MKLKYIAILLATILLATVAAWAVNEYIISNHIIGEAENYILTLNVNASSPWMVGDTLKFTGTLTSSTYYFPNVNVTLWCNNAYTGNWTLTNSTGGYAILYPLKTAGTYDFYTNATIT